MGNSCCNKSLVTADAAVSLGSSKGRAEGKYNPVEAHGKGHLSEYTVKEHSSMPEGYSVNERDIKLESQLQFKPFFRRIPTDIPADVKVSDKYWVYSRRGEKKKGLYQGSFNAVGFREGKGRIVWTDGSIYNGQWKEDKADGWGYFIYPAGEYYIGQFRNGLAHGQGLYHHVEGSEYEGEWADDKKNGKGKETWPDGSIFEGHFRNSKKSGQGHFRWADKNQYIGEFIDDNFHGRGKYSWSDGRVYEGEWADNHMNGNGTLEYSDGRKYIGEFKNDKKDGKGKFYWDNTEKRWFDGFWKNGKQDGTGYYSESNEIYEGTWTNGDVVWKDDRKPPNNLKNRK